MTNILDNRLNAILKKEVTPLLKALKFKKRRLNYAYGFDELCWLVNIQGSSQKSVKTLIPAQSDELHCWSQDKAHGDRRPL